MGDLQGPAARQKAEIQRLEEKLTVECRARDNRIAELERITEAQAQEVRGVKERLKKTEELLQVRIAELTEAQAFLSKVDRLSEMEVLNVVSDLNENIVQLAASLTAAWEQLEPPQATDPIKVDLTSEHHHSVLVQLACERNPTGLTFLLQSRLCYQAVTLTSSWVRDQKSGGLGSVYRHLSASGEDRIINTKLCVTYVS